MISSLNKILLSKEITSNFVRFYLVGLILFIIPYTRDLFISITAFSLVLVIGIVFYFHRQWNLKTIIFFLFIIISSFILEMIGTTTGKLFGIYEYDRGLGIKVNQTPLIIGINWLFLVYASHDIANRLSSRKLCRILIGSTIMIIYDILLEWVAPPMQMWHFDSIYPYFQNFLTWFIASILYHSGFEILKIRTNNMPARRLIIIQAIFFVFVGTYSWLFVK